MSMDTAETPHSSAFAKADFYRRFQQEETTLQEQLIRLKGPAIQDSDRVSVTAQCQSSISQLSDLLKDASSYLPAYDQRTFSTAIKNLRDKLQETRTAAAPKRKFTFKKTVPQKDSPTPANDGLKEASTQGQQASSNVSDAISSTQATTAPTIKSQAPDSGPSAAVIISSLSHAHYTLPPPSPRPASSASILDCQYSMIDLSITTTLSQAFATMTIKSITESLLLCGKVSGAIHITGVERSTLVIDSRQVRMHECKDCVVYLRCSSRPIIEDCRGIRFAPLPSMFDVDEPHSPNLWNQVDDFKWLRAEHSPNWSILSPEDGRAVTNQAWENIIAAKGQASEMDELLRTAKIIT